MVDRDASKVSEDRKHVNVRAAATQSEWFEPTRPAFQGPFEPSENAHVTAHLDKRPESLPIDQIGITVPDAVFAWDDEVRIDKRDRVAVSITPPVDTKRHRTTIIFGAFLLAILGTAWVGGSHFDVLGVSQATLPIKQVN